jgi:hypothetical protein
MKVDNALTVQATGVTLATGAASASTAIPVTSGGVVPRFVRISATVPVGVKMGTTAATATANDCMIQPGDALVVASQGNGFVACINVTATSGFFNVTPLEY